MSSMLGSHWEIYFTGKWTQETLQPGSKFDDFKRCLEIGLFKCVSWLNGWVFGCDDRGLLEEGVKTYLNALMFPYELPSSFSVFTSMVYAFITSFESDL
jgi:hypothetical protein